MEGWYDRGGVAGLMAAGKLCLLKVTFSVERRLGSSFSLDSRTRDDLSCFALRICMELSPIALRPVRCALPPATSFLVMVLKADAETLEKATYERPELSSTVVSNRIDDALSG